MGMDSANGRFLRQGMVDQCRNMTPAQRVSAFFKHSRIVRQIFTAGKLRRKELLGKEDLSDNEDGRGLLPLLDGVCGFLDVKGIGWTHIGALATAYHGLVRASLHAEILLSMKAADLDFDGLADTLRSQGLTVEVRMGGEGDPLGFVVRISDGCSNQVDLIGGIPRLDPDFFERSTEDEFDGMRFRMASPEDLIALKVYAGGPKDIEDAKGVIEVQEARIDNELVIRLCKRFGRESEAVCRKLLLPPQ